MGITVALDELMETILADRPYYEGSGGGLTLSGGSLFKKNLCFL